MSEKVQHTAICPDVGDGRGEAISFRADDPDQSLATDIVLAVAEVTGTDPTELRPLHDVIDADALDRLFHQESSGAETDRISFNYHCYRVTVYRDSEILLQPRGTTDP